MEGNVKFKGFINSDSWVLLLGIDFKDHYTRRKLTFSFLCFHLEVSWLTPVELNLPERGFIGLAQKIWEALKKWWAKAKPELIRIIDAIIEEMGNDYGKSRKEKSSDITNVDVDHLYPNEDVVEAQARALVKTKEAVQVEKEDSRV